MRPSIGRIVHFTRKNTNVYAALITGVTKTLPAPPEGKDYKATDENVYSVALRVFKEDAADDYCLGSVPFTKAKAGTDEACCKWSWPERVQ